MSKRPSKTDIDHFNRVDGYAAKVDVLYKAAIQEATRLASAAGVNTKKPFDINDYPAIKKRFNAVISYLFKNIEITIKQANELEWNFSNDVNDALVKSLFPEAVPNKFMNRNLDALKAFQERKVNGMDLSKRIWNLENQFRGELEMGIDIGLSDGRSAAQLSQDVRQYLNNPEMLFRRVRDARGVLQLSKRAANYHPGRGMYRSSYKNAMRLTRTEVNMAYRTSDHERMQKLDFIAGFEVRLSNNHPVYDICDTLKGKYPKEFKFVGWHPQCRCHVVTVLCNKDELSRMTDQILNGDDTSKFRSVNQVNDVPADFSKWIKDNQLRASNWKSQPYFIRDNFKTGTIDGGLLNKIPNSLDITPSPGLLDFNTPDQLEKNIRLAQRQKIDSQDLFTGPDGKYTPERTRLHDEIIDKLMLEAESAERRVYMLGGAPANGKSTLVNSGILPHPKNMLQVDSDKIKSMLPEYKHMIATGNNAAAKFAHEESSHISKRLMDRALVDQKDFLLDGVNDGDFEKMFKKVGKYQNSGNRVRADYVTLDSDMSLKLAQDRALKTGRFVPEKYIRDMNSEVSKLVPQLIEKKVFDELYLWDTNINKNPRIILSMIDGRVTIHDKQLYKNFLSKAR